MDSYGLFHISEEDVGEMSPRLHLNVLYALLFLAGMSHVERCLSKQVDVK